MDLAAKPLSKISSSAQVRKRLSRKSPGPELRKTLRSIPPPTNVTGPETVKHIHFLGLKKWEKLVIFVFSLKFLVFSCMDQSNIPLVV